MLLSSATLNPVRCCANNQPTARAQPGCIVFHFHICETRGGEGWGDQGRARVQMDFINGSVVNKKVVKWAAK